MARNYKQINDIYGGEKPDGIPRQRSRCRIVVYSHYTDINKGEHDLSRDVISCDTSKSIKGGGGANFTLVPRRNYLNLLFPNDYVFILFDPGDGRGWTYSFFGFIDRVNRNVTVDPAGVSTTRYVVTCSDFTKAFDATQIYFNPQIGQRPDMIGQFAGTANLGGVMLRTAGVTMHGSPADIVMSICQCMFGFGAQFMLPPALADKARKTIEANRQKRIEWAQDRLPKTFKDKMIPLGDGGYLITALGLQSEINAKAQALVSSGGFEDTPRGLSKARTFVLTQMYDLPADIFNVPEVRAALTIEYGASIPQTYLIDLIDFRHVEWKSMDGVIMSASITWEQGSLWSIMNAWSNSIIDELFCDLRPMQDEPSATPGGKQAKEVWEGGYSRQPDDLGLNTDVENGKPIAAPGVRFSPCLVMREHPFGTIQDYMPPGSVRVLNQHLGKIVIGAIFSRGPNEPGRKVIQVPAMHEYLLNDTTQANRHLDVVVISVKDIISENIGRSDHDHFNLLEIYSDITSGTIQHSQQLLRDHMPITSAINIARHGLRVKKLTTKFARFTETGRERVDNAPTRKVLLRWALLMDHWYQHNIEYLNGTMVTRAFPEIRVGYRLDILERRESYYVESVQQKWTYPNPMTTTLQLSRGQRNDPYPVYVYPSTPGFKGMRAEGSRLGDYFFTMNPEAVEAASVLTPKQRNRSEYVLPRGGNPSIESPQNIVDIPEATMSAWANPGNEAGYEAENYSSAELEKLYEASGGLAILRGLTVPTLMPPKANSGLVGALTPPSLELPTGDKSGGT